jgi:hypothetical protein
MLRLLVKKLLPQLEHGKLTQVKLQFQDLLMELQPLSAEQPVMLLMLLMSMQSESLTAM